MRLETRVCRLHAVPSLYVETLETSLRVLVLLVTSAARPTVVQNAYLIKTASVHLLA